MNAVIYGIFAVVVILPCIWLEFRPKDAPLVATGLGALLLGGLSVAVVQTLGWAVILTFYAAFMAGVGGVVLLVLLVTGVLGFLGAALRG